MHQERRVKVNAWIDEGIVALVESLNSHHQVVTIDSCECANDGLAYVMFTTKDVDDLHAMTELLAKKLAGRDLPVVIAVEWWYGGTAPSATIRCQPDAVDAVSHALTDLVPAGQAMSNGPPCPVLNAQA